MSENHRLPDYHDHISRPPLMHAVSWKDWIKEDLLAVKRMQQAVIMSLIIIGEAATKIMYGYGELTQAHRDVPWRSMRNMRNCMAHGYFEIDPDVVWDTVQLWLPHLLEQFPAVRQDANHLNPNSEGMHL